MDMSWMQPLPLRFDLDEATERQAEEAASRYVSFVTPGYNGYLAQRDVLPPNGTSPYGIGAMTGFGAGPNQMPGANFGPVPGFSGIGDLSKPGSPVGVPAFTTGPTGNWGTGLPGDFGGWVGGGPMTSMPMPSEVVMAGATGPTVAPMTNPTVAMAPALVSMSVPSHEMQPMPSPIVVETPAIATEEIQDTPEEKVEKAEEPAKTQTESPENEAPPQQANSGTDVSTGDDQAVESSPPMLPEGATADAEPPSVTAPSPITTATPRATGSTASPKGQASPGGSTPSRMSWANIVSKDLEASNPQSSSMVMEDMKSSRKDSIIDYLLLLAKAKEEPTDGTVDVPEDLRKFKNATESGMVVHSKAKYSRRGMRNTENNCYVNVIIQSLLPCSALMQILSHCSPDYERPFHTGMHKLCREFHSKSHTEALDVLGLPQVKKIISDWQLIGAQQDAGEFLFYLLNGLHDECKWKIVPDEGTSSSSQDTGTAKEGAEGDQTSKDDEQLRPDVRSSGDHEDSPIFRIFGGIIRSSVQTRNSKTDSVSLEPFNGLTLDISSSSVDSVWSALEAYCGKEDVNEGNATKRLQFKAVPRVLILNLKRFSYNKDTGYPQKIKKTVKFDERLTFDRRWLIDDVEPREYLLTGVICHFGDLVTGGHYTAAVKYNSDWYMYDDVLVRQIDFREVSQLAPHAYLLLYQCHDRVDIRP